jgi:hypothetical protein
MNLLPPSIPEHQQRKNRENLFLGFRIFRWGEHLWENIA